jgi:hypothetical protein
MSTPGPRVTQDVAIQDQTSELINLYLYRNDVQPNLTSSAAVGDKVLNIDTNAGLVNGEAITLFEGVRHSQCIIQASSATTVTVTPPVDFAYTTAASIEVGRWNMNVNGSVTAQTFAVHPPPGIDMDVYELRFSMQDGTAMDASKFGGISALTNGIVVQFKNGFTKNLGVIVNNAGFIEQGFRTEYDDRAGGTGLYAYTGYANGPGHYGVAVRLEGATVDEFRVVVQDNLTGLSNLNFTIGGHAVVH